MGYAAYENLRKDYDKFTLLEKDVLRNPIKQFEKWFQEALDGEVEEPNAMGLSTVSNGKPSSRIVLLKGVTDDGFVFYTNYDSQKGNEIEENPNVSLLFFWDKLQRQVRIEGVISKLDRKKSEEYFESRPYKSKIGALASEQSRIAENREEIENSFKDCEAKYPENPPCPENWGGYLVTPNNIEFWQGRRSRLHDRLVYTKGSGWEINRLYP